MTAENPRSHEQGKLVHATSHPTVRIIAKRFEQSPYASKYATADTLFGIYCNRFYPMSLGEDVLAQYWKLRREVMLFDVPEKPLDIRGRDAVTLLERVFTRRVGDLGIGRARYAIACTPNGGIQMDGVLIRLAEEHFWYVQANGEFESWLVAHSEGLAVTVRDPESRVLQVQGPRALDVMRDATAGAIQDDFGYFHAGFFRLGSQQLLVTRTGWTGELGFEIYSNSHGDTDHAALWDHLMATGTPYGMQNAALEVMGIRRIEAGILDYGTDIDSSMTPYDIGLGNFIDFGKDRFVGRDALQSADRRQRFFGLVSGAGVPRVGDEILQDGTTVGRIRVGEWSPTLQCGIGYVLFENPASEGQHWPGSELTLRGPGGEIHDAEVVPLPFYDRKKNIPRGLAAEDG